VFSMDGDVADLDGLCSVCADHHALLVLDEAHTVLGPGLSEDDRHGAEVLRVGTLSKAVGSLGGFVAGPRPLIDLLVNRARSFIFTTGLTPADTAAALAAVRIIDSPEGGALVERLRAHVDQLVPGHPSPIVPILVGSEDAAVASSDSLAERGLLVPAIRPPTVAPGTSRLRVTLSADHTTAEVDALRAALTELGLLGS
jgi:8-amino-7-oxononanoate synthase